MIYMDTFETKLIPQSPVTCCTILPAYFKKTLYFLHGYQETPEQILKNSNLENLAEQYNLAIVIPDVPSNFYLNQTWNLTTGNTHCYTEKFLIEELIPTVQVKYKLSTRKEDTYIAGVSMGGFGSLLLGSHYPDLFGKIASISGAFIIDDLLIGNPEVTGGNQNFPHFYNLFGPIWELEFSVERNPLCATRKAYEQGARSPIFLSCGTSDMLYQRNQIMYAHLTSLGAKVTWKEVSGKHNWDCFGLVLKEMIDWMTQ